MPAGSTRGHAACGGQGIRLQLTALQYTLPHSAHCLFSDLHAGGSNEAGQLGCGKQPAQLFSTAAPCQVTSPEPFLNVTAGFVTSCGIQAGGALLCW